MRRFCLPLSLLAVLCALQLLALLRAPAAWMPESITISLPPGDTLTLGAQDLAAPRAAARQLQLRRDPQGRWMVRNLDPSLPLLLRSGERVQRTSDLPLAPGQQIQAGASRLTVQAAAGGRAQLHDGRQRWDFDGATLRRDAQAQSACPDTPPGARLVAWWNLAAPQAWTIARPLQLGGNLHCGNRFAIGQLEPGQAAILRGPDGALALSVRGPAPLLATGGSLWTDVAQREHALAGVDGLVVGRTAFTLGVDGGALRLVPSGQVALAAVPTLPLAAGLAWQWRQRDAWRLPLPPLPGWIAACAILLPGAALAWLRRDDRPRIAAAAALAACAALVLAAQRAAQAPGAGVSLLLAWGALALLALWPRRPQLLALAALALLGAGLLVQLEMGLGARDSAWLRHFQNTAALLALGLPAAQLALDGWRRGAASRRGTEAVLLAAALLALAGVLLQVWFGNETGVFEIQPVEFAKLALAALSAHCLALAAGSGEGRRDWRFWLRMAAPALLFAILLAAALVRVDDYSPLLLLLVWAGAMAFAWSCATRQRLAAILIAASACLALAGGAALQRAAGTLGAWGFYPERFQVWSDPAAHPHTGRQMLLGARAIAQGGWLGADGVLGLATLGQPAGEALAIPAVQDDFAPSFLIQRHGLAAALALWCAQALFLVALLRAARRAWRQAGDGGYRRAWLGRFQYFALCGGAAFVAGHLLLSWGTNLAMFPIMGQPMSFLSAGGSHLLFFICPLLVFGMASTQLHEESQSCRSMSNTKS